MSGPTACEARKSAVAQALGDLARELSELDVLIDTLAGRLQPVCVSVPEAALNVRDPRAVEPPKPMASTFVEELRSFKGRAEGLSRRLRKLLDTCEV